MNKVLLDASALLAFFNDEKGGDFVEDLLSISFISSVNVAEVISELYYTSGVPIDEARYMVVNSVNQVINFDLNMSVKAGELKKETKKYGLSLGDRACIATGIEKQIPIYTADKIWDKLKLNIDIRLIR